MKTLQQIEPRTPISALPATLTVSGSYYLTTNLTCLACTNHLNGIGLSVSNVTIDLNGFELVGPAGSGSGIENNGAHNIQVKNGTVRGWGFDGINLANATFCTIGDVRAIQNTLDGIIVGAQSLVQNCVVDSGQISCITVGAGSTVHNCSVQNSNGAGISAGYGATVTDCTANNNGTGIYMSSGGLVKRCVANSNIDGLLSNADTTFEECSCMNNSEAGIRPQQRCRVVGNQCNGNGQAGILLIDGPSNVIDGNTAMNNNNPPTGFRGGIVCIGVNHNLIIRNHASGNGLADYNISGTNAVGDIINVYGAASFNSVNPWANFIY